MWLIKCLGLSKKKTLKKKREITSPETPGEELSQAPSLTPNEKPKSTAKKCRNLKIIIVLYSLFFLAEVSTGIYTRSLALIADSFHMFNDLSGFIVSLTAIHLAQEEEVPQNLPYGWKRAGIIGAFINGAFLLGLSLSTFLLSVERFLTVPHLKNPIIILGIGCAGFTLNVVSITFLHDLHYHGPGHSHGDCASCSSKDLGIKAVLMHLIGDVFNNIGIIISAVIIWKLKHPARFYADPAISMVIAFVILTTALPICKESAYILMHGTPSCIDKDFITEKLKKENDLKDAEIDNLCIWSLNEEENVASICMTTPFYSIEHFEKQQWLIKSILGKFGVQNVTVEQKLLPIIELQELVPSPQSTPPRKLTPPPQHPRSQPSSSQEPDSRIQRYHSQKLPASGSKSKIVEDNDSLQKATSDPEPKEKKLKGIATPTGLDLTLQQTPQSHGPIQQQSSQSEDPKLPSPSQPKKPLSIIEDFKPKFLSFSFQPKHRHRHDGGCCGSSLITHDVSGEVFSKDKIKDQNVIELATLSEAHPAPQQTSLPQELIPRRPSQLEEPELQLRQQLQMIRPRPHSQSQESPSLQKVSCTEKQKSLTSDSTSSQEPTASLEPSNLQSGREWEPTTSLEPPNLQSLREQESTSSLGTIKVEATLKLKSYKSKKDHRK